MEITPETTTALAAFLSGIVSGGGAYVGAKWLFDEFERLGRPITARMKRWLVLPVCLLIVGLAMALQVALGIAPITPDGILIGLTTAFTASQLFHAQELAG